MLENSRGDEELFKEFDEAEASKVSKHLSLDLVQRRVTEG